MGNGNALIEEGLIKKLEVTIQGHSLKLLVYLLPVSGADLVLGAAWLATLGAHISDYSKLVLNFCLGNQFVTLQGEQTKLPTQAQFDHMRRMHQKQMLLMSCLHCKWNLLYLHWINGLTSRLI